MEYSSEQAVNDLNIVTLLLRLAVGIVFFFFGLSKFLGGYEEFAGGLIVNFTEKT